MADPIVINKLAEDPEFLKLDPTEQRLMLNHVLNLNPSSSATTAHGVTQGPPVVRGDVDNLIELVRPYLAQAGSKLAGGAVAGTRVGGALAKPTELSAYALIDNLMQSLKSKQDSTVLGSVTGQEPDSMGGKLANTAQQWVANKAGEKILGGVGRIIKGQVNVGRPDIYNFNPTGSQLATREELRIAPLFKVLEDVAARKNKGRALEDSAMAAEGQALKLSQEFSSGRGTGFRKPTFTDDQMRDPALMFHAIANDIPVEKVGTPGYSKIGYRQEKVGFTPISYTKPNEAGYVPLSYNKEPITRTVTPSSAITETRHITRTTTPTTTKTFERPNLTGVNRETGRFQKMSVDTEEPSVFESRVVPGQPRTIKVGEETVVTGSTIGRPVTTKIGEEITTIPGSPRTVKVPDTGGQVVPGQTRQVPTGNKLVTQGKEVPATPDVRYAETPKELDVLMNDPVRMQEVLTKSQMSGNFNLRSDIKAVKFRRMWQDATEEGLDGQVKINVDKLVQSITGPEKQGALNVIYNKGDLETIRQFASNVEGTQDQMLPGSRIWMTRGGFGLSTGLLSTVVGIGGAGLSGAGLTAAALFVPAAAMGKLLTSKSTGPLIVKMAGGQPLEASEQYAARAIANVLYGSTVYVVDNKGVKHPHTMDKGKDGSFKLEPQKDVPNASIGPSLLP